MKVTYKTQEADALQPLLIVVAGNGPTLFGRNGLQMIQLEKYSIYDYRPRQITAETRDPFKGGVGNNKRHTSTIA